MKFSLTATNSRKLTQLCYKLNDFCLFGSRSGVLDGEWRINFFKIICLFFFAITTRLSWKAICTISTTHHTCRFLVLKRKIQDVRASVALSTVVETGIFVDWKQNLLFVWACRTKHISNNILNSFLHLLGNVNPLVKRQEKGICLISKRNIAHLAHRRSLRTLIIASAERLKSILVQTKCTRTFCIRTKHVPNEINSAIILPTNRGESTSYCKCSQFLPTCLQRNIGSCRSGDFCDG